MLFFKQKRAYEMRISDWSSDVCSSDLLHLARNSGHQRELRANPAMIPDAIDEFMRAFAAVMTFRVCVKETQIQGVTIKPGDKVAMYTKLAARNPDEWTRHHALILNRKQLHVTTRRSVGWGNEVYVRVDLRTPPPTQK